MIIKNFKPTAMRCTEEQYAEIKPELIKLGCIIDETNITSFYEDYYLLNNMDSIPNNIGNIGILFSKDRNRTVYEVWNADVFLENCGKVFERATLFENGEPHRSIHAYTYKNVQINQPFEINMPKDLLSLKADIINSTFTLYGIGYNKKRCVMRKFVLHNVGCSISPCLQMHYICPVQYDGVFLFEIL